MNATKQTIVRTIGSWFFVCCLMQNVPAQIAWNQNGLPQHFQNTGVNTQPDNTSDQQETPLQIQINSLPKVPASMIPKSGTFWSLQHSLLGAYPPLPSNPFSNNPTNSGVEIYAFADGSFLLNDLNVNYAALQANGGGQTNTPMTPQGGPPTSPVFNFTWLNLFAGIGTNAGQLQVETKNLGGGWFWGIASRTNLNSYDPTKDSWTLMDITQFLYDLDGSTYLFSMPPFNKAVEFYKSFDVQDYFDGSWTPIRYLGSNLHSGQSVTTNDVIMRFDLKGDIYKFFTNTAKAVQATVVRPSGETAGCFAEISPDGIATIVAPVDNFATGTNYVWVSFSNEGPEYDDSTPSQQIDYSYLDSLSIPNQEAYLASIIPNLSVTGETTNKHAHTFTGYLVFKAAPPIEDAVADLYVTPYVNGNTAFTRTYKYQGGVNASFSVELYTTNNQLIAQTNGSAQLDGNNEYTFQADLDVPENTLSNLDAVVTVVHAQPILSGNIVPHAAGGGSSKKTFYVLDQTKFRGIYNSAAWASVNYLVPFPNGQPAAAILYNFAYYSDGFLKHAADSVLTDIGSLFQYGFSQAIPDPYVLSLIPAYQYNGSQIAHFCEVLTNSLYMGFNFLSHSGAGQDLFNDPNLNLSELSKAAGNLANNNSTLGSRTPGQPVPIYITYKRRMDVWMEASCGGSWRYDAEYFGTPKNVDQTVSQMQPTVAFGYDVDSFTPFVGGPHFEELGHQFYLTGIFGNSPLQAFRAVRNANALNPVVRDNYHPTFQGSPNKTCKPNSLLR